MSGKMDPLRFYFVTYNVGTSSPDQDLHKLLDLSPNEKIDSNLNDFYIIGLQEVKAQPQNMLIDAIFDDPWTYAVREILEKRDYVKVKSLRLQGLLLNIFCLRKHLLYLREIETQYTRTGLRGMWGNKGAVSIRMTIRGCSVCFVNAHLTAHDHMQKDRIEDYNSILKENTFNAKVTSEIMFHDYVFWMGDLNFRLMGETTTSSADIVQLVNKDKLAELLDRDQLQDAMVKEEAFSELTERRPQFPPTFKFVVGTSDYDTKRRPAWTDRILYKVSTNAYENVILTIDQHSYRSHPGYTLSDHKPVTSDFTINFPIHRPKRITSKISQARNVDVQDGVGRLVACVNDSYGFGDYGQVFVQPVDHAVALTVVPPWWIDEENVISYKICEHIETTDADWIAIFKDDFSSLDNYESYIYVRNGNSSGRSTPTEQNEVAAGGNAPVELASRQHYMTFPDSAIHDPGMYQLFYFNVRDSCTSIYGMSEPFPAQKREKERTPSPKWDLVD